MNKSSVFNSNHTTVAIEVRYDNNVATQEIKKESFDGNPDRKSKTELVRNNWSPRFVVESVHEEAKEAGRSRKNSVDTETEMNWSRWKFYNDVIQDEMKKSREIDECLRDGVKTFQQIFDKLIEG